MRVSDEEGRFQLTDLPAGRWRVTVSKGGYFTWQPGQKRPFEQPPPITLARGQRVRADVPLSRGGVITGRVSDDTGEPLAGLRVRVYRARMAKGYRRLEDVGAADYTDDTGAYRIFGLPPGDYYVAASLRMAPLDSVVQTTYSPTYYPGTGELAEAQRIRVELGSESTAIFPLLPVSARHRHRQRADLVWRARERVPRTSNPSRPSSALHWASAASRSRMERSRFRMSHQDATRSTRRCAATAHPRPAARR